MNTKSSKKLNNANGHKKNPSDFQKTQKGTQKASFENRIKRFMQKSDVDKQLEQKVKQRLKQIRKQIVNHREWTHEDQQTKNLNEANRKILS